MFSLLASRNILLLGDLRILVSLSWAWFINFSQVDYALPFLIFQNSAQYVMTSSIKQIHQKLGWILYKTQGSAPDPMRVRFRYRGYFTEKSVIKSPINKTIMGKFSTSGPSYSTYLFFCMYTSKFVSISVVYIPGLDGTHLSFRKVDAAILPMTIA